MPELPEVETVRRSLVPLLVGFKITAVTVRETRLRRPIADDFSASLVGKTIRAIDRRGKYLHFALNDNCIWLVHLGMTGQLVVEEPRSALLTHDHIVITLSSGRWLRYHDPRRFGLMAVGTVEEIHSMTLLGCEPLSREFTGRYLWEKSRTTRRPMKDFLMDQRVVAGIGNIYANELLFRAGVHPGRIAMTLDSLEAERIVKATKTVLREAIRHRGSSISDYRDGEGKRGAFQQRFRVYEREGAQCHICRTPIQRQIHGGRSSFFCPTCQR
ncbi:MAG: bifunctional DNA-formamidopyrimidine glycosylase/DNA-(apurinic or apyrimidinic site) lyase [Candidatus Binatia bacterium]